MTCAIIYYIIYSYYRHGHLAVYYVVFSFVLLLEFKNENLCFPRRKGIPYVCLCVCFFFKLLTITVDKYCTTKTSAVRWSAFVCPSVYTFYVLAVMCKSRIYMATIVFCYTSKSRIKPLCDVLFMCTR